MARARIRLPGVQRLLFDWRWTSTFVNRVNTAMGKVRQTARVRN